MQRIGLALLLLAIASGPALAAPVALSADGEGSALIAPFWSVRGGHDALLSLRNNSDAATSAKLRLVEADGVEVLSLNVYLDAQDTWVAALTNAGTDQAPEDELITADATCILPAPTRDDAGVARIELPPLVHGHGYLEIIEMGRADFGLSIATTSWPDCDELAERFETGDWRDDPSVGLIPAIGWLSATVQIINVGVGGMVSPEVAALRGFSDIVQHTSPDSEVPNLSTAHTADTDAGRTESRVCDGEGCSVYAWNLPVEAVASVLAAQRFEASYSANPAIRGKAAFVYTRPLARFEGEAFGIDGNALLAARGRDAELRAGYDVCVPVPPVVGRPICGTRFIQGRRTRPVDVVHLGEPVTGAPERSLLGTLDALILETSITGIGVDDLIAGEFELLISQNTEGDDRVLTSADGQIVRGDPVVGFAVQQFSNGRLELPVGDPVLSNYRVVEPLIHLSIEPSGTEEE
ncbi:MAG: hypothetical protein WD397_04625 [Wenzhouxiangellaceae bacterium]